MAEHLFVIGPQRAGTTWIYQLLCQQPEGVFIDRIEKENYFFVEPVAATNEAYQNRFLSKLSGQGEPQLYADVVSTYFGHPEIIKRILMTFPQAKFVYIYRDEEERKKSFTEHREFNKLAVSIIGYIVSWELYEKQSKFDTHVSELKTLVGPEQLLQLNFEDLKKSNGADWTNALNHFLDFDVTHQDLGQVNKSRADSSLLKRLAYVGIRLIQATRVHIVWKRMRARFLTTKKR